MLIEVKSLLNFDVESERERVTAAFTERPERLVELLQILTRFERGEFDELAAEDGVLSHATLELLHPVVGQVLRGTAYRAASAGAGSVGYPLYHVLPA